MFCAACGATGESLKLKLCTACKAVRYCDVSCQKKHIKAHREKCKRTELDLKVQNVFAGLESLSHASPQADLDNPNSDLWKSPPRPECPICMLTFPAKPGKVMYMTCCGKSVCGGCVLKNSAIIDENNIVGRVNAPLEQTCPFCRKAPPSTMKEAMARAKKRMDLNDSEAFMCTAGYYIRGEGVPKDERKALEYLLRAVELGNIGACFEVAECYSTGELFDADEAKYKEYLQLAAMRGDVGARHNLGLLEYKKSRRDLAVRHFQIAASSGLEDSLRCIKELYKRGLVSKAIFAESLLSYQAALEEQKSEERDEFVKETKRNSTSL